MNTLIWLVVTWLALLLVARQGWGLRAAAAVLLISGVLGFSLSWAILALLVLVVGGLCALLSVDSLRRQWLTPKAFALFKKVAPRVSPTEQVALDAGTVGWDGELFSGAPNWDELIKQPYTGLSKEEQAFLDHQCEVALGMVNGYDVAIERADLPEELWDYLKQERFFGMIIPKAYGGLEFSAKAQSAVLQKLAVNETLMSTVGVPNSLGPGELLLKYGTQEQKDYYLPRLADGREIPCFGLTGPRAGSDATSIPDTGILCQGEYNGQSVLGIRLNFEKRWITLAPVATVVGLAFRLFDPEHLLGAEEDLGITCALVPRDIAGMQIGRRHHPIGGPFMNGPIWGRDVFIPLEFVIGGQTMVGQGWRMLVECLSVGRCITLPSSAAGSGRYCLGWSGGFARVRRQFKLPVAEMEGVQAPLARLAASVYVASAAVNHTAQMIDNGQKPAVPSAILKYHLTEMQRQMAMDAMDIHGGKAVTLGPRNYLGILFAATPVAITVEGANIMTRSLMIFGQGVIRCHPWVLKELAAKDADDLAGFDQALMGHLGYVYRNAARAFCGALGWQASTPFRGEAGRYAQEVERFSAALGLLSDVAMGLLGSSLKKRELISARLGDILANLYLLSLTLKAWHEGDKVADEEALMEYSCQWLLHRLESAIDELLSNLPNAYIRFKLRATILPLGRRWGMPKDELTRRIARAVSVNSPLRRKLLQGAWQNWQSGQKDNPLASYNQLLEDYAEAEPLYKLINQAANEGKLPLQALHPEEAIEAALQAGVLTANQATFMQYFEARVLEMLTVDDFAFDALARPRKQKERLDEEASTAS
ncbi:acyl-CoA dehydrogenase [Balneatrix alpica]|uniref:acyl-CoA dehydrogenase n=1 Tax=Balneatrix alpica TaxID=75684 RepID=UPI002739ACB2|nr:acyl-CoA dehydrogenase [Balneatrix alpica]